MFNVPDEQTLNLVIQVFFLSTKNIHKELKNVSFIS